MGEGRKKAKESGCAPPETKCWLRHCCALNSHFSMIISVPPDSLKCRDGSFGLN